MRFCWAEIPRRFVTSWVPGSWTLHGVWPEPVGPDVCFRSAGITDFSDAASNEWSEGYSSLIESMLSNLSRYGAGTTRWPIKAESPFGPTFGPTRRWLRRIRGLDPEPDPFEGRILTDPVEQLIAVTDWLRDDLPDAVVDFGKPPVVTIRASYGHAILWVAANKAARLDIAELVRAAASGTAVRECLEPIAWSHLVPEVPPCSIGPGV